MRVHLPEYYEKFQCIADKCSDSCCRGWRKIEIDKNTYDKYTKLSDDFSSEIMEQIKNINGQYFFKLKEGRCPFLNDRNLCEIYIKEGKDMLCTTCSAYPRFVYSKNEDVYGALTMSCPSVADTIIGAKQPVQYYLYEDDEKKTEIFQDIKLIEEGEEPLWKRLILITIAPDDNEALEDSEFSQTVYDALDKFEVDRYIRGEIVEDFCNIFYEIIRNKPGFDKVKHIIGNNVSRDYKMYERTMKKIETAFKKYHNYIKFNKRDDIVNEFQNFLCYGLYRSKASCYGKNEYFASVFTMTAAAVSLFVLQAFDWLENGDTEYETRVDLFHCYSKAFEHSDKMREKIWDRFRDQGYMNMAVIISLLTP